MTSTLYHPSPTGSLSCMLPIELWDKIMQEVEAIEDKALTVDIWAAGKAMMGYYDNEFLSREVPKWRNCLRTFKSLVLVCRLWRDIFTPFLYSSLHVTRRGVCGAVSSHQIAEILRSHPSYRHHLRRLEIWSTESVMECASLISICDRLQILGIPKNFDWTEVTQFVSELPVLKKLCIRYSQPARHGRWAVLERSLEPFPAIVTFPNLHVLQVSVYRDRLLSSPSFTLPSLRILKLDTLDAVSYPILSRVASTLQEIETGGFISSKDSWVTDLVHTPFPRLQKITITFGRGYVAWLTSVFPPPVPALRTLDISGCPRYLVHSVKDALDIKSKYGVQWAPKLDVIRALLYPCDHAGRCTEQCIDNVKSIEWLACQDTARGLNIRLEINRRDMR